MVSPRGNDKRNEVRNSMMIMRHFPDLSSASVRLKQINFPLSMTSQKRYTELGIIRSDASSEWNFYARFSDVILRETCGGVASCRLVSQGSAV